MTDTTKNDFEGVADDLSSEDKAQLDAIRSGKEIPVNEPEPVEPDEVDDEGDEEPELEAKQEEPAQPDKKKDGRVPLRKLMAAEEKAKAYEKELTEQREKFARADERLRLLFQAQQQAQQPKAEAPPDPTQDPIGAIEYTNKQLQATQEQLQAAQRERQEAQFVSQVENVYKRSWSELLNSDPNAVQAYQHFTNQLSSYFAMRGASPEQANELVKQEERAIAYTALQQGKNPAQLIYENMKATGFNPTPTPKPQNNEAEKKVEMRAKGQAAAKSLSNVGGKSSDGMPSAEEIASMSEDEFMELKSRLSDRQMARILGAA